MLKRSLVVLSLYLILAIVFTYPLSFNLSTRAPAGEAWTYDGFSMLWNLWWFKHALLDLSTNPFFTNHIFTPLGVPLYLHSYTVFSDLVAIPLLPFLDVVSASNLILIGSLVLCGFGTYLLAQVVLVHQGITNTFVLSSAAFVAGIVFAFTTNRFVFLSQGHYNFFTTEWLPFYMLYWVKLVRQPTRRSLIMAALFLALTFLVELSLGVMLGLITGLYIALTFRRTPHALKGLFAAVAVMGLAVLMDAPYLVPAMRESLDPKYIPQFWGGAPVLSTDVVGMFAPSSLSTFFGTHDWPREWLQVLQRQSRFVDLNTFVIGLGVAALALLGAWVMRRAARVWIWLTLILVVLSWGPILHVNGQSVFDLDGIPVTVGLPYIILHYIPALNGLRAPHRFGVAAMLMLAMLVAFAVSWLLARRGMNQVAQFAILAIVTIAVSVEHIAVPIPLHVTAIPHVYERIAAEPGDFSIMDIPLGWRSGFGPVGSENTQLQYYQIAHQKNLLSGFAARTPSFIFDYFERQPILNAIAMLEVEGRLPKGDTVHDKTLAAELAYFFDLRYILVHPPASAPTPYTTTMRRVEDYIREVFDLDLLDEADGIKLYRINQPAPSANLMIDFGAERSNLNRAAGWDRNEEIAGASANWMTEPEAHIFVPLRMMANYHLSFRAVPFVYPNHPAQTIAIRWNGKTIAQSLALSDSWSEYSIEIAAADVKPGLNEITFVASRSASPSDMLSGNSDTRRLSMAVDWIKLELQ